MCTIIITTQVIDWAMGGKTTFKLVRIINIINNVELVIKWYAITYKTCIINNIIIPIIIHIKLVEV